MNASKPRPRHPSHARYPGGVWLRHLTLVTQTTRPTWEERQAFRTALAERLARAFPQTDPRVPPLAVDLVYSHNVHSERSLTLDLVSTFTSGLMFITPEAGVALVDVGISVDAPADAVDSPRRYRVGLTVVGPYQTLFLPWFDREARQIRTNQTHRVAFDKIEAHLSWWLSRPRGAPHPTAPRPSATKPSAHEKPAAPAWYSLKRHVHGEQQYLEREEQGDAVVAHEVVTAKERTSALATTMQILGGFSVGYSYGLAWVTSRVRDSLGDPYDLASGRGVNHGAGVVLYVPPKTSGLYFFPTVGFLWQEIRIQDIEGVAEQAEAEGATDIRAVATDPQTGAPVDLAAPWGYRLNMTSLYLGQRLGLALVLGGDRAQFWTSLEGGINLLEWRYMHVRWGDYVVDGHRFAGAHSFAGRFILGFAYRPWHLAANFQLSYEYFRRFRYPEPIPFRGRQEYDPVLDIYVRPEKWAHALALQTLSFHFGVVVFY